MTNWFNNYTCPDCGAGCIGHELIYPVGEQQMYVCPHCGCVQEVSVIEQQLGKEN